MTEEMEDLEPQEEFELEPISRKSDKILTPTKANPN